LKTAIAAVVSVHSPVDCLRGLPRQQVQQQQLTQALALVASLGTCGTCYTVSFQMMGALPKLLRLQQVLAGAGSLQLTSAAMVRPLPSY
jgi:hypothetical protein